MRPPGHWNILGQSLTVPTGFGQSHSRGVGVSGDAGGAYGGALVEHHGLWKSQGLWEGGCCESGRQGSGKRVSDGPATVRCPLNLLRLGGGLCCLQEEAAICGCSLLWKAPSVLQMSALGHHW